LETDLEKYPEELSVGMRRRLEMARALVGWPSIMLFDEPTSGLDPINARKVLDLIIRARDTYKISSICATKEMSDISYLANHHAVQDKTGISIVKGYAPPAGRLAVMVLDEGMLSFVGTESEFQGSQNPSVATLTGLQINPAPASDSYKHLSS
jgi:phospholipid/cholesterol/gamma-HCH transport system ATP-binding protein